MENGGSSNQRQTLSAKTGIIINETTANNPTNATNPQPSYKRAADQYMPIAQVVRIMRHVLPAHAKISDGVKETVQECVSEFINFVTTKANERCHKEYRKTITPDDVISAMGLLGFDNYVESLNVFLDKRHAAQDHAASGVMNHQKPYARHGVHGPAAAQMAQPPAVAPAMEHCDNNVGFPLQMGSYYMGNQRGGEGGSGGAELDSFPELFRQKSCAKHSSIGKK